MNHSDMGGSICEETRRKWARDGAETEPVPGAVVIRVRYRETHIAHSFDPNL